MSDLISREEAAKRLEALADKYDKMGMHYDESCFLFAAKIVRGVPSAVRWIPVSERLPEPNEIVMVWSDITRDMETISRLDCFEEDQATHWMPLPEPPEKKGEPINETN